MEGLMATVVALDASPTTVLASMRGSITDARVARSTRPVITGTYGKLRPTALKHVAAAGPRLGQLLERHFPPLS